MSVYEGSDGRGEGKMSVNTAKAIRFLVRICLDEADKSPFSSLRCAVEKLTGAVILFQHNYALGAEEAVLINTGEIFYELQFNPDHVVSGNWKNRKTVAHELLHVLEMCPSKIDRVSNFCSEERFGEEARANAFAALATAARPKVATRRLKTKEELQSMLADLEGGTTHEREGAEIFATIIDQIGDKLSFNPPLVCDRQEPGCDQIIGDEYHHTTHHNIEASDIWHFCI